MRSSLTWWMLLGSICVAGGLACSSDDDKQTGTGALQGTAGSAPMMRPSGNTTPAEPTPPATVPDTPVRGPSEGAVPTAGGLDQGQQNSGSAARDAGADAAAADAGLAIAPDAGSAPPPPADAGAAAVRFADVLPILVANCGSCHGTGRGGLPQFAVADEAAAFAATQALSNNAPVSTRIIARAVTARTMPPSCGGGALGTGTCLSAADAAELQAWVNQGANP
jgi:hypothetical protein